VHAWQCVFGERWLGEKYEVLGVFDPVLLSPSGSGKLDTVATGGWPVSKAALSLTALAEMPCPGEN